jgi:hypothetical protein
VKIPGNQDIYLFAHTGPSMNPTLASSDLLEVRPYKEKPPCRGDVILFMPAGFDQPHQPHQPIVHRIVKLAGSGIITRGDNGTADDPWQLKPQEVFGQVIAACRGSKRRQIAGGVAGLLLATMLRGRKTMCRAAALANGICKDKSLKKMWRAFN